MQDFADDSQEAGQESTVAKVRRHPNPDQPEPEVPWGSGSLFMKKNREEIGEKLEEKKRTELERNSNLPGEGETSVKAHNKRNRAKRDNDLKAQPAAKRQRRTKRPSKSQKEICITTINVRGLGRQKHKQDALCSFLEEQKIDVGVITETHMSVTEVEAFSIKRYEAVAKSGRTDAAAGGVMILISTELDAEEIKDIPKYPPHISVCSAIIYPHEIERSGIRITGVYLSPTAKPSAEDLKPLTSQQEQSWNKEGEQLNHLIIGDFNPTSWKGEKGKLFQEWLAENELWELTDPTIPTHMEGSALDKILLLPGESVLWDLLPPEIENGKTHTSEEGGRLEEEYYPAETYPCPLIADHHPILLRLAGSTSKNRPPVRKLRVAGMNKQEWAERNADLEEILKEKKETIEQVHQEQNTDRYYSILLESIGKALEDKYQKN